MKLFNVLIVAIALALGGGFVWFAMMDVPVEQHSITEAIPNERLGI